MRVGEVLESRYGPGRRPISWDERRPGVEKIKTDSGEVITLRSGGGQSSPAPGWELLLIRESSGLEMPRQSSVGTTAAPDATNPLEWTLYGIGPKASK
ncbi:MAG: hypothetical protein U0136_20330 [Bdellovibrionota bacterium]